MNVTVSQNQSKTPIIRAKKTSGCLVTTINGDHCEVQSILVAPDTVIRDALIQAIVCFGTLVSQIEAEIEKKEFEVAIEPNEVKV